MSRSGGGAITVTGSAGSFQVSAGDPVGVPTLSVLGNAAATLANGTATAESSKVFVLTVTGTSGVYVLTDGTQDAVLDWNAGGNAIAAALEKLLSIGTGNVKVLPGVVAGTLQISFVNLATPPTLTLRSMTSATVDSVTATRLKVFNSTGSYQITDGVSSATLSYGATAADVQTALNGFGTIGAGHVNVTAVNGGFDIAFSGLSSPPMLAVTGTSGSLSLAKTLVPGIGSADTLRAGSGNNIVLGGAGGDSVTAGSGDDLVIGDNGQIDWAGAGVFGQFQTTGDAQGGVDSISVGNGNNVVLGGEGGDAITTGTGADLIVGDNGSILYSGATVGNVIVKMESTDTVDAPTWGDTILAGDGANRIIAGMGADTVTTTGNFDDIVMGDNGEFNWDTNGVMTSFLTTQIDKGGVDIIDVAGGNNIVVGGVGADKITTGAGNDVIVGDNGQVDYWAGSTQVKTARTTDDTVDQTGWGDTIVTGGGVNVVMAGVGSDHVNDPAAGFSPGSVPSSGNDYVMGDNGEFDWDTAGRLTLFKSTQPGFGGNDVVLVGDGANYVVGGFGNDVITTGTGADIILGDNGEVSYTAGTTLLLQAKTTDSTLGGDDTIIAGGGDNLILAGTGVDGVTAGSGNDLVIGDNGQIDWTAAGAYAQFQTTFLTDGGDDDIRVGDGDEHRRGWIRQGCDRDGDGGGPDPWRQRQVHVHDDGWGDQAHARGDDGPGCAATGDVDIIVTGGGTTQNIVLAGMGADRVNAPARMTSPSDPTGTASSGDDIVLGDNGFVTWDAAGVITEFASTLPTLGGNDVMDVGDGNNIVLGGFGKDDITTGLGDDVILGDSGDVNYFANVAKVQTAQSTATTWAMTT